MSKPATLRDAVTGTVIPSDLYGFAERLTQAEWSVIYELREVLDREVRPHLNEHWEAGTFPDEIRQPLNDLHLMDPRALRDAGEPVRGLFNGFLTLEMARLDASVATYYNAHASLFRTICARGGSPEQAVELDQKIRDHTVAGVFALTEPEHGSDIAGGLSTTARQNPADGTWVINGAKRWIGGALDADILATCARDEADGQVKCFLVPRQSAGVFMAKIHGKTALRIMQNAHITYDNVQVDANARLLAINSFGDISTCLRDARSGVPWMAVGVMAGAYEAALRYVRGRVQFGRPVASFQLIQEKLALMLGNITSSLGMAVQLTEMQSQGVYRDENSALAKMHTCLRMRESVAWAREICGGNGITLDTDVARFHADAEAVYSYEGTHEINALVVGRALAGVGAFV